MTRQIAAANLQLPNDDRAERSGPYMRADDRPNEVGRYDLRRRPGYLSEDGVAERIYVRRR
jgi:hypothetical protein